VKSISGTTTLGDAAASIKTAVQGVETAIQAALTTLSCK